MYFPIFVDLTGKKLLVVGGGTIATRRVRVLADFADEITVVAPQMSQGILELASRRELMTFETQMPECRQAKQSFEPALQEAVWCAAAPEDAAACACNIRLCRRPFRESDLDRHDLVFAATDNSILNREIWRLCRRRGIPVNVCSDQSLCDFQFPSVVQDGDVVVGINASGRNHTLVKKTRRQVEAALRVETERSKYDEK